MKMAFVFRSYAMLYALCAMLFCNYFWQGFLQFSRTEQGSLENCNVGGKKRILTDECFSKADPGGWVGEALASPFKATEVALTPRD